MMASHRWLPLFALFAAELAAAACGDPATPIHRIQGSGDRSPLVGEAHTVEAIVTASFQGKQRLNGFFLQEAVGDGDPATSEGLFVYAPRAPHLHSGERVRLRGAVSEFHRRTELSRIGGITRCGRAALPPPVPVTLPLAESARERLEGMRVRLAGPLVVSDVWALARHQQLVLSAGGRLYQPTQLHRPGPDAARLAADNAQNRLILDDGSRRRNPPPQYPEMRAGAETADAAGVLDQFDERYLLQPSAPAEFSGTAAPSAPPRAPSGSLRAAWLNVHNYFNGDGRGGGFPTSRGARSAREWAAQRRALVAQLAALDADILGLAEVENDGFGADSAVADLARTLTDETGARYAYIRAGADRLGSDAITVGLLYRSDRVRPRGRAAVLDARTDSHYSARNRPTLAQTFEQIADGARLTVAVTHLKSKGSSCADAGDPDRGDGQGNCNRTRSQAAQTIADWLADDPTASADPNVLLLGDLNAYAQEDPLRVLERAGLRNLVDRALGRHAYTYVFRGEAGCLDHALATAALARQTEAVRIWHVNADAPPQVRVSDHDPVVVDFALDAGR